MDNRNLYVDGPKPGRSSRGKLTRFSSRDSEGKVSGVFNYRSGVKNGPTQLLHENGMVLISGQHRGGKMTGTWYYYGLNGEVTDVVDYVNDLRHGEWIGFYPSGGLLEIVRYHRDKKHGLYKRFTMSGKINLTGRYRQDKKVGLWRVYHHDTGEYIRTEKWDNDVLIGVSGTQWSKTGG
jgi:antitoxin component YwqK of YwqJK toxin-antitoxin module